MPFFPKDQIILSWGLSRLNHLVVVVGVVGVVAGAAGVRVD